MLFDLRGRGKRRTIQAIYLFLAILLGGGLIFFGIGGGGGGGGLLNAVGQGSGSGSDPFQSDVTAAKKRVKATPKNPAAWAALANAQYEVAASGDGFNSTAGTFTTKGKADLAQARTAWTKYLSFNPKTPDPDLATEMVRAFEPAALNLPAEAVSTQEILVAQNPSSPDNYATLAVLAYLAGQTRKGDLAAAKAVTLEPKASQAELKTQLATDKTQAQAEVAAEANQGSGAAQTTATLPDG